MHVKNAISQGEVQDRRRRRRRKKRRKRSGGQGWKEWERETVPSWPGSKNTAWWSERSQDTAGKTESNRIRKVRRRALQTYGKITTAGQKKNVGGGES